MSSPAIHRLLTRCNTTYLLSSPKRPVSPKNELQQHVQMLLDNLTKPDAAPIKKATTLSENIQDLERLGNLFNKANAQKSCEKHLAAIESISKSLADPTNSLDPSKTNDILKATRLLASQGNNPAIRKNLEKFFSQALDTALKTGQFDNYIRLLKNADIHHLRLPMQIKDEHLPKIAELKTLKSLNMGLCTLITGRGLAHIAQLPALNSLYLGKCEQLENKDLIPCKRMSKLASLTLSGCSKISRNGIKHLKDCHELFLLDLSGCNNSISEGLMFLRELKKLKHVWLPGSSQCYDFAKLRTIGYQTL